MNDERGNWYLLTGLVLGILLGLFYAWRVRPLEYSETSPSMLAPQFKDQYRALIASAYQANPDLVRAQARLQLLEDPDPAAALSEQAQRALTSGLEAGEAQALGMLAIALGGQAQPVEPALDPPSPEAPTEDAAPTPESPPEPTPTAGPPDVSAPSTTAYTLQEQQPVCDPTLTEPLIQVQVLDSSGEPEPGVELLISWEEGQESVFTGLKPELGEGYADFAITESFTYSVRPAQGGETASDLTVQQCSSSGGDEFPGGWLLTFIRD